MRLALTAAVIALAALSGCETKGPTEATPEAVVPPPPGPPPADLADLVGTPAAGDAPLQSRGYVSARRQDPIAFWWNAATKTCARVVTTDGRIASVNTARPTDCGF